MKSECSVSNIRALWGLTDLLVECRLAKLGDTISHSDCTLNDFLLLAEHVVREKETPLPVDLSDIRTQWTHHE